MSESMTRRDWFAAFALAGLYAGEICGEGSVSTYAIYAIQIADEMIELTEGTE